MQRAPSFSVLGLVFIRVRLRCSAHILSLSAMRKRRNKDCRSKTLNVKHSNGERLKLSSSLRSERVFVNPVRVALHSYGVFGHLKVRCCKTAPKRSFRYNDPRLVLLNTLTQTAGLSGTLDIVISNQYEGSVHRFLLPIGLQSTNHLCSKPNPEDVISQQIRLKDEVDAANVSDV